ncbi:MAG: hypothetical protein NTW19_08855 [Planctomycetota bacterium]|nr:hypothetical protein [Planctomycetota bacterium]
MANALASGLVDHLEKKAPRNVAVVGCSDPRRPDQLLTAVDQLLIVSLQQCGRFTLLEKERVAAVIDERNIRTADGYTAELSPDAAARLGKLMAVDGIILVSAIKAASTNEWTFTSRMVDVNTRKICSTSHTMLNTSALTSPQDLQLVVADPEWIDGRMLAAWLTERTGSDVRIRRPEEATSARQVTVELERAESRTFDMSPGNHTLQTQRAIDVRVIVGVWRADKPIVEAVFEGTAAAGADENFRGLVRSATSQALRRALADRRVVDGVQAIVNRSDTGNN